MKFQFSLGSLLTMGTVTPAIPSRASATSDPSVVALSRTARGLLVSCLWGVGCGASGPAASVDGDDDAGFGPPPPPYVEGGSAVDASGEMSEGGFAVLDGGVIPADRFITKVVSYSLGACSGFGLDVMPQIVEGPPVGGGASLGSTDVLSLGNGGEIVVSFEPNAIVDGPGVDFIVFENPFDYGNDQRYVEPGEVSVSEDGVTWTAFPCTDTTQVDPDGGWGATQCGGMNVVYSNPDNGISPLDPITAGGDAYDLADIGVKHAKYVRIIDQVVESWCNDQNGFDLDAIAIVNAELP
jgi:hypothetical protein